MSQLRVRLSVFVNVRCRRKGSGEAVQVHYRAFTDVQKDANVALASG